MGAINAIEKPVILFDGVCNLCNGAVNFVIDRDPDSRFLFAPLQSQYAKDHIPAELHAVDSILLFEKGRVYVKSDAALRIARRLKGWPHFLWYFIFIPRFFRDWVYDMIAANRYRWFGKKDACRLPTPELTSRFISSPIVS